MFHVRKLIPSFSGKSFTYVIPSRLILCRSLYGVGQETEDGTNPQKNREATEKLTTEFDPLRGGRRGSQGIGAIPCQVLCCLGISQTLGVPGNGVVDRKRGREQKWLRRDQEWKDAENRKNRTIILKRPNINAFLKMQEQLTCTISVLYFLQTSSTDILCSV